MKQTLIHQVLKDQFVQRTIVYAISFVLIGAIFSIMFEIVFRLNIIQMLEAISNNLP